jgi:putative mRNA 3-end processing factor
MRLKFLGGAEEVGRLAMLLEADGRRFLFDYGLTASDPPKYPLQCPPVDYLLLTHSHLDHSGMVPWVCGRYETPVLATSMTKEISEVIFEDNLKVSNLEGYPQLYDKGDIKTTKRCFSKVKFGEKRDLGPFEVHFHYAGHIPGATMFLLEGEKKVMFTGDINTIDTKLLKGTEPVKCDTLIIEGTYAGRDHPNRLNMEYEFLKKVDEVVERGGIAVIPAFAIGRTQEAMLLLENSKHEIWVDGMGNGITDIYTYRPEFISDAKKLKKMKKKVNVVYSYKGREMAVGGDVIITTSGMLDGGPIISYLEKLKDEPKNAILMTGYQVEGSNGRQLLDNGTINIRGVSQKISCEVDFFDFSAHSGHKELLQFIRGCDPEEVVLCHSEDREAISKELEGEFKVHLPKTGEELEI